jgi:hypothetical protein
MDSESGKERPCPEKHSETSDANKPREDNLVETILTLKKGQQVSTRTLIRVRGFLVFDGGHTHLGKLKRRPFQASIRTLDLHRDLSKSYPVSDK